MLPSIPLEQRRRLPSCSGIYFAISADDEVLSMLMTRKPYSSDLTDAEWAVLRPLLPQELPIGSPRTVELREVVNALMYVADNGIK